MNISVILPTLNAASYLRALILRLQEQTIAPMEIIVVDSGSDDETPRLAKELGAEVLSVRREAFDHGGTRNWAASKACGDVLVFMTQDALPASERFLEALVAPFGEAGVAGVCGRQIARPDASVLERMTREINYPNRRMHKTIRDLDRYGIKLFFFTNVCSAIRKDVFLELGGFPEPIILNEDMMLAAKCILGGYSLVYEPDAAVIHSHDYSLRKQFRRNFDIGVSLRMNEWVLEHAGAEKEGGKLIKQQLFRLWSEGHRRWIPRWFLEACAKYAGYRLGLAYRSLPQRLRPKLSMHAGFWSRQVDGRPTSPVEHNFPAI